jgi:TetR/AcrR family transcriptional regulator, fatty acid metabolism regulator protein
MGQTTTTRTGAPGVRSLRERQREERAVLILEAAQQVFAEKGYHDASIDEIAARTGVAKGTVYLHYASKQDLLVALLEQEVVRFIACVDRVSNETQSVRVRIERLLLYVYERMQAKRNQVLLEQHTSMGITHQVIESRAELKAQIAQVLERITALLEHGKHSDELDPTVPTPIMLATFISLISPSGYEQVLSSGAVSPEQLVGYVSRIFFPARVAE